MESNNLKRIVRINENIKTVVTQAHKINLLALNAILLSRRAGRAALGFGVISNELRVFSKELTETMRLLMQLSFASVGVVSSSQRYQRLNRLMNLACAQSQRQDMEQHLSISNDKLASMNQQLGLCFQQLNNNLEQADNASRFGSVIARSLKIEATYGASFTNMLMQIADDFSKYIDQVQILLTQVQGYLKQS